MEYDNKFRQSSDTIIKLAEGALSPRAAYDWYWPMRKTWGYGTDPEKVCKHLAKHEDVKRLIWC